MNTQTQKTPFNLIMTRLEKQLELHFFNIKNTLNNQTNQHSYILEQIIDELRKENEDLEEKCGNLQVEGTQVLQLKEQHEQEVQFLEKKCGNLQVEAGQVLQLKEQISRMKNGFAKTKKELKLLKKDYNQLKQGTCYEMCKYCRIHYPSQVIESALFFVKKDLWCCEDCCEENHKDIWLSWGNEE